MSASSSSSSGIGFVGLLAVAFIVLKLTHVIDWTWFWVLSPLWMPFALLLLVFVAVAVVFAIKEIVSP